MVKWYSATQVAKLLNAATATIIAHCEAGSMPAINIARETSKRRRWRISEEHLAEFTNRRSNRRSVEKMTKKPHRVLRPNKDYFASPDASPDASPRGKKSSDGRR